MRLLKAQNTNLRNIYGAGIRYDVNGQVIIDSSNTLNIPNKLNKSKKPNKKILNTDYIDGKDLLIYGKKITYAIGEKLVKITPSRGVSIELSSALVIILGSRLKIPLSTTHCQVGATVGVGLLENKSCNKKIEGVNWWILTKTAFGWIITCLAVGLSTGIFVSQGAYAPIVKNLASCSNNTLYYYFVNYK